MDTTVLQKLVAETIGLAWRKLREIEWKNYGPGIVLRNDAGHPKYQGLMVMHQPRGSDFKSLMILGQLSDSDKSFEVVSAKLRAIEESDNKLCSIDFRNPPIVWGGAVRQDNGDLWGITGLPEVADHITVVLVLYHLGLLNHLEQSAFLNATAPGVAAARANVNMSQKSYGQLVCLMNDIIRVAARHA